MGKFKDWLKLRKESEDSFGEQLCYCGHTDKCDCSNPTKTMFKEAVDRGDVKLGDINNGWQSQDILQRI
jgi:histidinol phosphatase-like enzyme